MSLAARKLLWTVIQDDPVAFSGVCNCVCAAGGEVREWVRPWSFWTRRPIHPSLPWVYARGHGSSMCATSTATTTQLKLCHYTRSFKESEKKRTWFIIFDLFRKALFTVSCHWFWSFLWNVSPSVGWIALIFGTDIHSAQKMDCIHFGDPLTFHLAPPEGQSYHLSKWNISTSTGRTDTNVCTGICGSQTMNDTDFGDHLTFTLANHKVDICGFQ